LFGNRDCLKYDDENDVFGMKTLVMMLLFHGNVDCLKYAHEMDVLGMNKHVYKLVLKNFKIDKGQIHDIT